MILASNGIIASQIAQFTGLLDTYPNAAAAYSVRLLRSAYSGSAIRVRRSSDNAEQDIGFVSGNLDTSSLTSFCGAGNGFVTTWYDQSGNGRNATQTTAANQPQIVSSGSVILENSKPALNFDGSNDYFGITSFTFSSSNYHSFVGKRTTSGKALLGLTGNMYTLTLWTDNNYYLQANTNGYQSSNSTDTTTNRLLLTGFREGSGNQKIYKNNNLISSTFNSYTIANDISAIGKYLPASTYLNGTLQEIIYYNSDQSSNRTGIESNINTYYAIY